MDYRNVTCEAREFVKISRGYLWLPLLCVVIGIVLGCIAAAQIHAVLDEERMSDYLLGWYFGKTFSFGSCFGNAILDVVVFGLGIMLTNVAVWLLWANYLLVILRVYRRL